MFIHSSENLLHLCAQALQWAKAAGASAAEADIAETLSQGVSVRLGEIEQIEHSQNTALSLTVFFGLRKGVAATADLSPDAVRQTVQAAADIARFTGEDSCNGLADAALMAREPGSLDVFHPQIFDTSAAAECARICEAAALSAHARIANSEGAGVSLYHGQYAYANTHGFAAVEKKSRHGIYCAAVAADNGAMQRDFWSDASCRAADLDTPENIGRTAAQRACARLNPRPVPTGKYPVVFARDVSGSLIGHLTAALGGGALYRKSSFLCGSLGRQIFSPVVQLREEPHLPRRLASAYYDDEGVATRPRDIVKNGVIEGYFLSSYTARKLGMQTTANAGGAHGLILQPTTAPGGGVADLLAQMGTGLLVTELMGNGANILTGDYSRGASGFWVENGTIAYPVSEITIASRLQEMYAQIVGIADDALPRSTHKIGAVLIENMTVAGAPVQAA